MLQTIAPFGTPLSTMYRPPLRLEHATCIFQFPELWRPTSAGLFDRRHTFQPKHKARLRCQLHGDGNGSEWFQQERWAQCLGLSFAQHLHTQPGFAGAAVSGINPDCLDRRQYRNGDRHIDHYGRQWSPDALNDRQLDGHKMSQGVKRISFTSEKQRSAKCKAWV